MLTPSEAFSLRFCVVASGPVLANWPDGPPISVEPFREQFLRHGWHRVKPAYRIHRFHKKHREAGSA